MQEFSRLTGRQKFVEVVRWVLVLPAACVGSLAPGFLLRLVMPPLVVLPPGVPREPPSELRRWVSSLTAYVMVGLIFVLTGGKTAPRSRFAAALGLAVLWTVNAWLSHVHFQPGNEHYAHFGLAATSAFAGAFLIAVSERRRHVGQVVAGSPVPTPSSCGRVS